MTFLSQTSTVPTIVLNDGNAIPQVGYGVWQIPDDEANKAVSEALKVGYRSIDTAKAYDNETGTGQAIKDSGIARNELFITTKLWNDDQGYDSTLKAFDDSMTRLGLDYLDMYLIHWQQLDRGEWLNTFKAFQTLKSEGRIRSIGVSNFTIPTLEKLIDECGEAPAVNQIELHPRFIQTELREFHVSKGIATEAWSPLGQGKVLDDPTLKAIADAHDVTAAQVILRWHVQLGNIVIPKSVTPARIASNFDVYGFELSQDELTTISGLDAKDGRIGPDPDKFSS